MSSVNGWRMATVAVFVSYSRKQFYVAEHLVYLLEQHDVPAWLDVQQIQPGGDWQATIDEALATCQALVVLASRAAYRSAAVQREVTAARAAGKPIYLAVLEDNPFVAELGAAATAIDCRRQFSPSVEALAQAIRTGKQPQAPYRRGNPLSVRMPFGRVKYLQLIVLNLCFLVGTGTILLRKQIVIHGPLNPRLLPYLVLATIPALLWTLGFIYSLALLISFRRQRSATYLALELWPMLNLFAFPALFGFLLFYSATTSGGLGYGPYFTSYLNISDRLDVLLTPQITLIFTTYAAYAVYVALTLRGCLLVAGWIALIPVLTSSLVPPLVRPLALLVVGGAIAFLGMRGFLSGRDVPVAFGEQTAKFDFTSLKTVFPQDDRSWGRWLSPGAFPNEMFRRRALHTHGTQLAQAVGEDLASLNAILAHDDRSWGRWLSLDVFLHESVRQQSLQAPGTRRAQAAVERTWHLFSVPADSGSAQEIRRVFAGYPALRESASERPYIQIAILSNKTPLGWINALAEQYPRLICVIVSALDINKLGDALHQHQWIDYRRQQSDQIHNLAKALTGVSEYANPITPENFLRPTGPYPVQLVSHALRMASVVSVAMAAATQYIAALDQVTLAPLPLVVTSVALGAWGWRVAGRLLARRAYFVELLLTFGTLLIFLSYWVFSGTASTLLPREVWVRNGAYNGALTTGLTFVASFAGIPFLAILLVAAFELVRRHATVRRWLPRYTRPERRRTLAVAPWRRLNVSAILYVAAAVVLVTMLGVDSPYRYQRIHEYDVPDTTAFPSRLLAGPDGNIWFSLSGSNSYQIGYITPAGELHPQHITLPQPADCRTGSSLALDCFEAGGLQFGPDHNLWYVAWQVFAPNTMEIRRSSVTGATAVFKLPSDSTNVSFAFDAAGNLWYTRAMYALQSDAQGWIGKLDPAGHITEFALPAHSAPASIVAGPDGSMWFFDDGTHTVGKITPEGVATELTLPYQSGLSGAAQEEMIVGPDHNLWFTDPQTAFVGRVTPAGELTLFSVGIGGFPYDLVAGPDGGVWFLDNRLDAIGHISTDGTLTHHPIHEHANHVSSLTVGS
ncbi:MAG TPA: TIR domain-containing protein, partial [Ktedonobacterales bacterium]|nr:TIR domain-containing protein [Ktedonobacterales bacterium]